MYYEEFEERVVAGVENVIGDYFDGVKVQVVFCHKVLSDGSDYFFWGLKIIEPIQSEGRYADLSSAYALYQEGAPIEFCVKLVIEDACGLKLMLVRKEGSSGWPCEYEYVPANKMFPKTDPSVSLLELESMEITL